MANEEVLTQLTFEEIYSKDIKKYVEKLKKTYKDKRTGQEKFFELSYLSWAYGHREMKRIDPDAKEEITMFPMMINGQPIANLSVPYLWTPQGYFVQAKVTINGRTESEMLPVLDNSNRPIANPNAFQINTSNKRCFVKALAKHGLGLYLYVGEDLPENIDDKQLEPFQPQSNERDQPQQPTYNQADDLINSTLGQMYPFFKERGMPKPTFLSGIEMRLGVESVYQANQSDVLNAGKLWQEEILNQEKPQQQPQQPQNNFKWGHQ
ncbi:DUF1071 domain-containing protein [Jeotgalibaca porci]|uniref:Sak single strand annealing protein n=1 Tax=Jeotgalibaca porci TaxID=1868793 RepID=UPI0035A128E9